MATDSEQVKKSATASAALNNRRRKICRDYKKLSDMYSESNLRKLWESANKINKISDQPQITYTEFKTLYIINEKTRKTLINLKTTEYERIKNMTSAEFDSYMLDALSTIINEKPWTHNAQSFPSIRGEAGDDARKIGIFLMIDLIHGKFRVAFSHITFLHSVIDNIISQHGDPDGFFALMKIRVEIIKKLSEMRNVRFMKMHNKTLIDMGLRPFKHADDFKCDIQDLVAQAILNHINPWPYFDTTDDLAEMEGTSNAFCFNQKRTENQGYMVVASDKVSAFIDAIGRVFIVGIERANAPGINSVAHAGGFNDKKTDGTFENVQETADREGDEEAKHNINELGITFKRIVDATLYKWWDFRPFACNGAMIGAAVNITYFR